MLYSISAAMTELDIVLRFTAVITIGTIFVRIDTEIDTVFENLQRYCNLCCLFYERALKLILICYRFTAVLGTVSF
jgi:hypothetical protein